MKYFNCERSSNYRAVFFENYKPIINGLYFCAYCGMPVRKRRITIDHLYPVSKAKYSRRFRRKLIRKRFEDINDFRNLVPACETCNKRKGSKISWAWVLKGKLGRVQWLWLPRHAIRITLIILIIEMGMQYFNK